MRMRVLFALSVVAALASVAEAGWLRNRTVVRSTSVTSCQGASCSAGASVAPTESVSVAIAVSSDAGALAEVNAKRAARGLRPFVHDPLLTAAAERCAAFRAQHGLFGHTQNDFAFLSGASAIAAGCAAYPAEYGWLSCCTYEGYTYAGAAYVTGRDGKRYMHLFVR